MGSSWKESGVKRRDARATKAPETSTPYRSSKNTRKWCRGKEGVPHTPQCRRYDEVKAPMTIGARVTVEWLEDVLPKSYEAELVEDMVSLMSSFSAKVYGRRSAENRKKKKAEAA